MLTMHMRDRLAERVPPESRAALEARMIRYAMQCPRGSIAIRVWRDARSHGTLTIGRDGTGESNGECLTMIVRDGHIVTVMWRRAVQPHTPETYRTERATCVRGTCHPSEGRGHRHGTL